MATRASRDWSRRERTTVLVVIVLGFAWFGALYAWKEHRVAVNEQYWACAEKYTDVVDMDFGERALNGSERTNELARRRCGEKEPGPVWLVHL